MKNQILSVDNTQYSKKSNSKPIEINNIIKFFIIVLILFGISCTTIGTYAIVENNNLGIGKPDIYVEKQNDKLLISTNSKKGIDKIVYFWNDETEENVIQCMGNTEFEEFIDLPVGNNTIKIDVYDINGKIAKYEESYQVESKEPQLSIEATDSGKVKITAKDYERMNYITYRWDDGEEIKVEATEESSAQIEQEINIPSGQHTLTVVAVNSNNLTSQREQEIKGVRKPIITVVQDADNMQYLFISVTDEEAVKKVEFNLNGKDYLIDLSEYHEKSIQYKQAMQEGENTITLKASNFDGAESTFEGTCTYTPQ